MSDMDNQIESDEDEFVAAAREAYEKISEQAPEKEATPEPEVEAVTPEAEELEAPAVEAEAPAEAEADAVVEDKPAAEAEKPRKAPIGWKPDAKEHWDKLPAEVRESVYAREAEINETLKKSSNERGFAQEVFKVAAKHDDLVRPTNMHPAAILDHYLGIERTLRSPDQKVRARSVADIIKNTGVDLDALNDAIIEMRGGTVEPRQDAVSALPAEVQEKLKEIDRLKALEDQRQQASQQQFQTALQTEFQKSGVGEKEWFEELRPKMQRLLELGEADSFQDAYDKAAWMSPDHRKVLLARQASTGVTTAQKMNAASSVKGTGPKSATRGAIKQYDSTEDAARAAYNRIMGGDN